MANKTLIRGAQVITVDDELGTIPGGDVLIEGGAIADVGRNLPADGAEVIDASTMICMPGFVDTHRHTWAAMLRGCGCYGDLQTYFQDVIFTYGAHYTPNDTYVSARFGLPEAIDSGITTLHAWEHNIQTPEHADAALQALRESGLRARFSYGPSNDPEAGSSFALGTQTVDLADIERLLRGPFATPDPMLDLGVALRGPEYSQPDVWQAEVAFARERGLPMSAHTMMTWREIENLRGIAVYAEHGALGPDLLLIHALQANEDEIRQLAETDTPLSFATWSELRCGMGLPPIVDAIRAGVRTCLSVDTMVASDNSDMFSLMRVTLGLERGRFADATVIQPEQVIRQATLGGAQAMGLGDVTGSLTPGKRADVILLQGDDLNLGPINVPEGQVVLAAQPRNVDTVWIDGVVRKRHGELVDIDVPALMRDAKSAVAGLTERVGRPLR